MKAKRTNIPRLSLVAGLGLTVLAVVLWAPWTSRRSQGHTDRPDRAPDPEHAQFRGFRQAGRGVVSGTAPLSPIRRELVTTLESIQMEPDPTRRDEQLDRFVASISMPDFPGALAFLQQNERPGANREVGLRLIRRWAEIDPQGAAGWAGEMPVGSLRQDALREVAVAWAVQNISEATEWLRQLAEDDRQAVMIPIAYETGRTDPIEAMKLAMALAPSEDRIELISHIARQWAGSDPKAAVAWASTLDDESLRERIVTGIATTWGESDVVAAAALAVKGMPPGRPRDDAVVGIVQRWVQSEPEQAAAWVTDFPAGSLRDAAVENLVKLWTDQDSEQVAHWLNGLELGSGRDFAIETYVSKITPGFPESAARWAESIGDDASRHRQMEAVGEDWLQLDQVAARTWIAQAALPEAAKARLLGVKQE